MPNGHERPQGRRYVPYPEKHKAPQGFGSLCQESVSLAHAQRLLDQSIPDPVAPDPAVLYAVCGEAAFVAHRGAPGTGDDDVWHGYPELGNHVPNAVLTAWRDRGLISQAAFKRLRRQTSLPERCGC